MEKKKQIQLLGLWTLCLMIMGCSMNSLMPIRHETARRIASPAWMLERQIPAAPFSLTAFERMHKHGESANIYIEGDGVAWLTRKRASLDPTPKNPVGLRLAAMDKSSNVAYLARPCQYSKLLNTEQRCNNAYWTGKRFAPEVLKSYDMALEDIRKRYGIKGFHLIGFSGGGALAALLAAERDDVLSLRTVAGNVDHVAHSNYHGVSILNGSLNPPEFSARLANIPQYHFIGGQDEIVPPAVLHSYLQSLGSSSCAQYQLVQEASHVEGWDQKWPELLARGTTCGRPVVSYDSGFTIEATLPVEPPPVYTPRINPAKP